MFVEFMEAKPAKLSKKKDADEDYLESAINYSICRRLSIVTLLKLLLNIFKDIFKGTFSSIMLGEETCLGAES